MQLSDQVRERIEQVISGDKVVLFMKGTRRQPMCGFSATTVGVLDSLLPSYTTVNVLEDDEIREGIKSFANWPTIPQLYIGGEFVGGCDIVNGMFNSGELHEVLGMDKPDRTPPELTITDNAAEAIRAGLAGQEGVALHLKIDGNWQNQFFLQPVSGEEIKTEANGLEIYMDLGTAQRANGMRIDWVDGLQGSGLSIDNPNAPPPVKSMSVADLKQKLQSEEDVRLYDTRPEQMRAEDGVIAEAKPLTKEAVEAIEALPKDTPLVFHCRSGQTSVDACEYFRGKGFTEVHNLEGGYNAWKEST